MKRTRVKLMWAIGAQRGIQIENSVKDGSPGEHESQLPRQRRDKVKFKHSRLSWYLYRRIKIFK